MVISKREWIFTLLAVLVAAGLFFGLHGTSYGHERFSLAACALMLTSACCAPNTVLRILFIGLSIGMVSADWLLSSEWLVDRNFEALICVIIFEAAIYVYLGIQLLRTVISVSKWKKS